MNVPTTQRPVFAELPHGARDLDLNLEIRLKFRGHEISIGAAAFPLAPTVDGLLVMHVLLQLTSRLNCHVFHMIITNVLDKCD